MTRTTPSYKRAPSPELKHLLSPGGFLRPLIELRKREVADLPLDVHLRHGDEVHVYCGRTRVVGVRRMRNGQIKASADKAYREISSGKALFRRWNTDEADEFERALDNHLREVQVGESWTKGEGAVQARWSCIQELWVPFDREAVLGYDSGGKPVFERVERARAQVEAIVESHGWANLSKPGGEVDQLAIDADGRLVVIELKDASSTSAKVYYAPLQLLHYVWEWHEAFRVVRGDVQSLIGARVALGLTTRPIPPLTGGIRPVVGFGPDRRSAEVKRRYRKVLEVVNRHLPPGVPPIETWALDDGAAQPRPAES